jgi:hypothetical protein
MSNLENTLVSRRPSDLADHPLLAHIPVWTREQPEFTALLDSIRERGLDYPVLIDAEDRIIDGRNRRNVLALLKEPVPCRRIGAGEAASVIVASLVNRRHLTKGALAYLSAPLFEPVLAESKERNLALLKSGVARLEGTVAHSVRHGPKTTEDLAAQLGISPRLFDQALKLRRLFDDTEPAIRAKYEPRILGEWQDESGEWQDPVGLGYMINGLTSLLTEAAGRKKQLGKRAQHDRLFVSYLPKLKEHWRKANAAQRAEIAEHLKAEVTKWPGELREEIATALRAASRADRE